ncbi:Fe-S cluster assembly ATPase SufC [Lachnospiraceae bacterium oral taxon 096]|jgi:feS assembly ATPase sufC|nr:Fe-S cluster assembly ATPase SufC [Lachnospiraceae bacterium]PTL28493.1 Fe-S cluster assembly ATPase SufC [Lachnospiraceae bacterium oral taxon 096]QUI96136.1 Fe-S cluster assembly ATPase SufC [Lachnospiraceae bacterium oral taxon 096]
MMSNELLNIQNLSVRVTEKPILHNLNLSVGAGETHVLMGPNGAGKSTLGNAIMGNPHYEITDGKIFFDGKDITHDSTDKRAKAGIFLSFQNPIEVPGISLGNFTRGALEAVTGQRMRLLAYKKESERILKLLSMDPSYASRDLNVGFSGGEKKKAEIFQLLMLKPKLAILDETDSGLDVDAVRIVSEGVRIYQEEVKGTLIIITHSTRILESLNVDRTHVLAGGNIIASGDASMIADINENGFEKYLENN